MRVMMFVKKFDFVYSYILHVFPYYFILFILCTIPQFSEMFSQSEIPYTFTRNALFRIRDVLNFDMDLIPHSIIGWRIRILLRIRILFFSGFQDANKKYVFFFSSLFAYFFL